ncbi:MAG: UDP-N-acetylmuramate--L-alanine ligase [Lachnospiraceae bacterium]|nr:UDP-N-acetylmuramate--L-alanine ligase [Lachnospiraceae bacterium]
MSNINFDKPCHIYFMGIGGISMSGFAHLLHDAGFTISGSDMKQSTITHGLEEKGIHINYSQIGENIHSDIDLVVYTAAIHPDNSEYIAAKALNIPMIDRAEMVGQVMKHYSNAIGISGTHGKTTTTSMLSHVFLEADMDPTISVGGILKAINSNIRIGKSQNFITEACEYTNSFLKFFPTVEIILNIEEDHMDFFKDLADIRNSFTKYANLLPETGIVVINGEIENHEEITSQCKGKVITYGTDSTEYTYSATNISFDEQGHGHYDLMKDGAFLTKVNLNVVGMHNISNSLAVFATCNELNIPTNFILDGILHFDGAVRRFEFKGSYNGFDIIDDYAHHPTEITATLTAAKNYPHKTLWTVFQPHTYTRTKAFLKEFGEALSHSDKIIITDIFAAREKPTGDISSLDLVEEIKKYNDNVYYFEKFNEIENFLINNCTNGDLLITMGAGNVVEIGENILNK